MAATFKVALADAYRSVPTPDGKRSALLFSHGTLEVKMYAPREKDDQTPHARDELYIIAQGTGDFVCQDSQKQEQRVHCGPGDVLFAAAATPHRFENFADDFFTWVIFYGPEGGEKSADKPAPEPPKDKEKGAA